MPSLKSLRGQNRLKRSSDCVDNPGFKTVKNVITREFDGVWSQRR
jgi:hypothetical protein